MSTHIFEPITDRFGYGKYLDLQIIVDSETKYINATKLCQLGGKKLYKWQENTSTKELIKYFNSAYNESPPPNSEEVTVSYEVKQQDIKGVSKIDQESISGTYYHKDLIVHIAQWISPAFAFKVSKIVNDYVGYENNRTIRELKGENKSLLDKVDDQSKQIAKLLANTETLVGMNHKQLTKLDDMSSEIKRIRTHLDNDTSKPNKRESILIYRTKDDPKSIMHIKCGTEEYLKRFRRVAVWYREYTNISNSKKAINYLRDEGLITFEKGNTTKIVIHDVDERSHLRRCLKELDASYA